MLFSAPECFTVHKEAMIPPNRVFRNSETNSFLICKSQCISEGMRCQSFALGISSGIGNGTCQLSSERNFEIAGRRPRNTIYDPQFNLYLRNENCNHPDKNEMPPKNEGKYITYSMIRSIITFHLRWINDVNNAR